MQLGGEAAVVANQIRVVDRKLDDLEHSVQGYISQGLRFGGAMNVKQRAADDEERKRLLAQRAELAEQLRRLTQPD